MIIRTAILIISDRSSRGERTDEGGPALRQVLDPKVFTEVDYRIIPDEKEKIREALLDLTDQKKCDLILTSGGTGLSPRDVTPEATAEVVDRLLPGFAEAMRLKSLASTPYAMISRAISGTRGGTLIVNLPGSPKGAFECLEVVLPAIPHAIAKLKGDQSDCGIHHGL